MNINSVEKIAAAVLYEGYLLYPYRASAVKNQQRFNFGVLYPAAYCTAQMGAEAWEMKTECLVLGDSSTTAEVKVRFLQMAVMGEERRLKAGGSQDWLPHIGQEGVEREAAAAPRSLESITERPYRREFVFPAEEDALRLELELGATPLDGGVFRLTLNLRNLAKLEDVEKLSRDEVLLHSLVSIHSILRVAGGEFVSLLDPPESFKAAAAGCQNLGSWPVLAGDEGQRDMMLSSPIILYDYPQIAPESPGDLFDGTEIDEILALRILTLTDAEKLEVRNGDERARRILERTEMLPPEHFQKLHGAMRSLRARPEGSQ